MNPRIEAGLARMVDAPVSAFVEIVKDLADEAISQGVAWAGMQTFLRNSMGADPLKQNFTPRPLPVSTIFSAEAPLFLEGSGKGMLTQHTATPIENRIILQRVLQATDSRTKIDAVVQLWGVKSNPAVINALKESVALEQDPVVRSVMVAVKAGDAYSLRKILDAQKIPLPIWLWDGPLPQP